MSDSIEIRGLELMTHVGVPDEEIAEAQLVKADLVILPATGFDQLDDQIEKTVDYFEVCQRLKKVASTGERRLIETLANDLAAEVLGFAGVNSVTVTIRKFILPDTEHVAVTVSRP